MQSRAPCSCQKLNESHVAQGRAKTKNMARVQKRHAIVEASKLCKHGQVMVAARSSESFSLSIRSQAFSFSCVAEIQLLGSNKGNSRSVLCCRSQNCSSVYVSGQPGLMMRPIGAAAMPTTTQLKGKTFHPLPLTENSCLCFEVLSQGVVQPDQHRPRLIYTTECVSLTVVPKFKEVAPDMKSLPTTNEQHVAKQIQKSTLEGSIYVWHQSGPTNRKCLPVMEPLVQKLVLSCNHEQLVKSTAISGCMLVGGISMCIHV